MNDLVQTTLIDVDEPTQQGRGGAHFNPVADLIKQEMTNDRVFEPDETSSNKLPAVYQVAKKSSIEDYFAEDKGGGEVQTRVV